MTILLSMSPKYQIQHSIYQEQSPKYKTEINLLMVLLLMEYALYMFWLYSSLPWLDYTRISLIIKLFFLFLCCTECYSYCLFLFCFSRSYSLFFSNSSNSLCTCLSWLFSHKFWDVFWDCFRRFSFRERHDKKSYFLGFTVYLFFVIMLLGRTTGVFHLGVPFVDFLDCKSFSYHVRIR